MIYFKDNPDELGHPNLWGHVNFCSPILYSHFYQMLFQQMRQTSNSYQWLRIIVAKAYYKKNNEESCSHVKSQHKNVEVRLVVGLPGLSLGQQHRYLKRYCEVCTCSNFFLRMFCYPLFVPITWHPCIIYGKWCC